MTMRVNLIMRFGKQSWSETHYLLGVTQDFFNGAVFATILANARAAMLGFDAFVVAARVSDPLNVNNSDLVDFNPPMQGQKFNINIGFITSFTSDSCGLANECVIVDGGSQQGGAFHQARPMLGAPPAGLIQSAAGVPVVQVAECPDWGKAFNAFSALMTNGNWGFRYKLEGAPFAVQAVGGGAGAPITLQVDNAFTPAPQAVIHVRGLRVHPQTRVRLAGLWRVLSVTAGPVGTNLIALGNSAGMPAGAFYLIPGTVQTTAPAYAPWTRYAIGTGGTRKRGGSIGAPRGRSRTRVLPVS